MAEDKSTVKTKQKPAKQQQKKTPAGNKKRRGPKKNVKTGKPYAATLQFRNLVSTHLVADVAKVTADPFDDEFTSQYARKVDTSTYQLTAAQCVKLAAHSEELVSADSNYPVRYCWRPPMTRSVQNANKIEVFADVRGQYVGVTSATLKLTNTSPVEIKVRGNTPKAIMDQPFDVNLRTHEFTIRLPPGATKNHKITWSNSKRDSPHMTPALNTMKLDSVSLCDFYVLMPDINPESNTEWSDATTILDIHTSVHYDVETMVLEGSIADSIKPFTLLTLGNYYNMFHVESEVAGLFSGTSRRQLTTGGSYYIAEATFVQDFNVGTTKNTAGTYLILHDYRGSASPLVIDGAPKEAVIYLPVVQQGIATLKKNAKYYQTVTTGMAVNIGAVDATLDGNSPYSGQKVSGPQMWVLVTAAGEALKSGSWNMVTPTADTLQTQPYQFLGGTVTVNYWPYWEGFSGQAAQKQLALHMKEMQQLGFSLMSVLLVLEAVTTIVNVIKGVSSAISKSN